MVQGIELALEQAGGKAGDVNVKYESLDDSTAQAGTWTPEATAQNARRAAQDDNVGAYIGEFNSGASAVSMPILNEAFVPQISPANTAVGLTSDEPGADRGEPEKYYPTGKRHYVRIVPKDTIQGAALATVMQGRTTIVIAHRPATIALADRVVLLDVPEPGAAVDLDTPDDYVRWSPG
ncbi:MAG: ABC transporter substrate-binding protein [Actinobacteria bacterium]|nr:ABC transporter substrate-binding protein [Actinomycetota bacterium]